MMDDEQRAGAALQAMWAARQRIDTASEVADPVQLRKLHVQAARLLRAAANALDDEGRLEE